MAADDRVKITQTRKLKSFKQFVEDTGGWSFRSRDRKQNQIRRAKGKNAIIRV